MKKYASICILTLYILIGMQTGVCSASQPITIQTGTPDVTAGILFEGAVLPFWGEVPEGCQVAVRASGPVIDYPVRPRNGSQIVLFPDHVCGLPSLYQILSSAPLLDTDQSVRDEIGIDEEYKAIRLKATVFEGNIPDDEESTSGLREIRVKQAIQQLIADHRYGHYEEAIEVDGTTYSGTLYIPAGGPQRDIQLTAYALKNGKIVGMTTGTVDLPRKFFTRPLGATEEERQIYLAIMVLAVIVFTLTLMEWLHKGKTAEQK